MFPLSRSAALVGPFLLVVALATVPPADATSNAAKPGAQMYVVSGVAEVVDVMLDGDPLEEDVESKSVLGPFPLAGGEHTIEFVGEDWSAAADLTPGQPSVDVVVHRPADADGDPVVTVFTNDVRPVAADRGRLTIAHTAVVPPADVRVSGEVLFSNIANGEFVSAEVPAETYEVDIVPTGETTPLLGPVDLPVTAGALNRVFAIGQPENGSMDAVVQVIPLPTRESPPPESVDAGSAGLVATPPAGASTGSAHAEPPAPVLLALLIAALGAAALGLGGAALRRSRDAAR